MSATPSSPSLALGSSNLIDRPAGADMAPRLVEAEGREIALTPGVDDAVEAQLVD